MKVLWLYLAIMLFKILINTYLYRKCIRILTNLQHNVKKIQGHLNYKYVTPTQDLLKRANVYSRNAQIRTCYSDQYDVRSICDALSQASGEYICRIKRSFAWLYYDSKKLLIFKPVFNVHTNKFIAIILCLLEGFAVYLLCLYLDETGLGKKILDYLLSLPDLILSFV